ncbi:MAG: hypothetical protein ABIR39_02910 [Nocardioides sp.]|uniref:hypothetical protein n=1 Tax=Nocardioides sp. TaxID=35761 RepID=UPI003265EFEA
MALPHQGDVEVVLDRQAAYPQAHGIGERAPGVGDHGHLDAAQNERQETLAMLDLHLGVARLASVLGSAQEALS